MRTYRVGVNSYPVFLEGRAWIDPPSFQVLRLESQLMSPVPEIELKMEHLMIDYAPVQFRSTRQEIWLPQEAELYVDRQKKRYFRKHTFSGFELFNVDTAQKLQTKLGSYVIINLSDKELACELKVTPAALMQGQTATVRFSVPAHATATKVVGLGRDVNLSPDAVASAVLTHNGRSDQVLVESSLVSGSEIAVTALVKSP
ncbi:MAG TPA: hypothetical protein VKT53_04880, partial [Candidatus Acidoferrum sp.]|nr:hypothetical protein [Candidatus Acidoferrum sp.]